MALKAIFVAPSAHQADYWATQWGYTRPEYKYVCTDRPEDLHGIGPMDVPVLAVGTQDPNYEMDALLERIGVVYIDGEDIR